MTEKDFLNWHRIKENIEFNNNRVYFHKREIWWCSLGVNVGFEQDGKGKNFARPVLIFKKFNKEIFWALPISAKIKIINVRSTVAMATPTSPHSRTAIMVAIAEAKILASITLVLTDTQIYFCSAFDTIKSKAILRKTNPHP